MLEEKLMKAEEEQHNEEQQETVTCTYSENGPTLQELLLEYIRKM